MRRPLLLAFLLLCACASDAPVTEPEGGFAAFRDALATRDASQVWATVDQAVHAEAEMAFEQLKTMEDRISQLQPSDQDEALEQSGVLALANVEDAFSMFETVFLASRIPDLTPGGRYADSLEVADVVRVDDRRAIVLTRGDQEFAVVSGDDGVWRVDEPVRSHLAAALAPMATNLASVERAVRLFGTGADELERMRRLGLVE